MKIGIRDIPAEPPRWNRREFFESAAPEDIAERLEDGADPDELDSDGRTPLHHAAVHGRWDLVEMLLKAGAGQQAGEFEWTPLHCAASAAGERQAILPLLAAGADVLARTGRGITPLHFAAMHGMIASVRLLLEAGSDPRAVDGAGRIQEFRAAEAGLAEAAAIILGWWERNRTGRVQATFN